MRLSPYWKILPILLFFTGAVLAYTVPQKIPVQGRLSNASTGVVLSGEYDFTFRIYNASTSGTLLWDENQTLTVDGNGLWNALLGNNTSLSLNFSEDTYLEVELNHDGNPLPRMQLGSTPYAEWTDTASNLSCTDCLGTDEIEDIYLLNKGDNATGDYMFNGTFKVENSSGSPLLFVNSSNGFVGIGTSDPSEDFVIKDAAGLSYVQMILNGSSSGGMQLINDVGQKWEIQSVSSTGTVPSGFIIYDRTNGEYKFVIQNGTGNVGIGTTSPSAKLEVNSGETNEVAEFTSSDSTAYISFVDDTGSAAIGTGAGILRLYSNGVSTLGMSIQTDGDIEIMNGNVGIGTTSPNEKLTISASVPNLGFIDSSLHATATAAKFEYANGASWDESRLGIYTRGNSALSEAISILGNGNVGIGTTGPNQLLEVSASKDANIRITSTKSDSGWTNNDTIGGIEFYGSDVSGVGAGVKTSIKAIQENDIYGNEFGLAFSTGGVTGEGNNIERLRIDSNGNVGIGTTSPDHDLEIGTGTYSEIDAGEAQFTTGSSREYKENINEVTVEDILKKIENIPVNTYDFRKEYCNGTDDKCKDKMGLIAEDFYTIFGRGSDKELSGQEVQMALWLAVQELKEENDVLKADNEALKQVVCELKPDASFCV